MVQSSTGIALPITFYRFRKDGTPNPDIKRAFLQILNITPEDAISGYLLSEDGSQWTLILETPVYEALKHSADVDCIVSFQVRRQGAYAVARLNKNSKQIETNTEEQS